MTLGILFSRPARLPQPEASSEARKPNRASALLSVPRHTFLVTGINRQRLKKTHAPPTLEQHCMRDSLPGLSGLVTAIIVTAFGITVVTGTISHWPIVILGILVGLWAVTIITRS